MYDSLRERDFLLQIICSRSLVAEGIEPWRWQLPGGRLAFRNTARRLYGRRVRFRVCRRSQSPRSARYQARSEWKEHGRLLCRGAGLRAVIGHVGSHARGRGEMRPTAVGTTWGAEPKRDTCCCEGPLQVSSHVRTASLRMRSVTAWLNEPLRRQVRIPIAQYELCLARLFLVRPTNSSPLERARTSESSRYGFRRVCFPT